MENAIYKKLSKMVESDDGIKSLVAKEALESGNPVFFFKDLLDYGCVSGMIGSLVWYNQTHEFYDNNYDEIEKIRREWEESVGEPLKVNDDLKNFFSWFSFEYVAAQVLDELPI